jgi:uncharacterized small protein (DUF1192 family)
MESKFKQYYIIDEKVRTYEHRIAFLMAEIERLD